MPRGVRAGLAALAVLVVSAAPAAGQQSGVDDPVAGSAAIEQQLGQYRQKYADESAEEVDVLARLDVAKQAKAVADDALARLDTQVSQATDRLSAAQVAVASAEQVAASAAARLASAAAAGDAAKVVLARQAIDTYMGQGQFGALTQTLDPVGPEQGLVANEYAQLAAKVQNGRLADARAARREADDARHAADAANATAAADRADVARQQSALVQARGDQAAAQARAAADLTTVQGLLVALQTQKAADQRELDQLAAESDSIAAMLRAHAQSSVPPAPAKTTATTARIPTATTSHTPSATNRPTATPPRATPTTAPAAPKVAATTVPPQPAPGPPSSTFPQNFNTGNPPDRGIRLSWPIPGTPLIGTFTMRMDPVLNVYRMHEGIDIGGGEGTPIHAAGSGTIIWAGPRNGYGDATFIDHGHGVVSIYAHQSRIGVSVGQHVSTGDVIGYVGHTGLAAGPHLHFEVRIDGTAYDPLKFVKPS